MAFFEMSRPAQRRMRIAAELPTEHPAQIDEMRALLAGLPEPELLCAEERAGAMSALQALRNGLDAYFTELVGAADAAADSAVLHAGTTGTLVAAATGQPTAVGSGVVATARALRDMPGAQESYRAGRMSTADVRALVTARQHLSDYEALESALVEVAEATDAAELRNLLTVLIAQDQPEETDKALDEQREKRGISLREQANGLFRLEGYLDGVEGRRLRDALTHFMDRPAPADTRSPAQRRVDALGDIAASAMANTKPLGVSGLTVLVDVENLDDGAKAVLEDGLPIGPAQFERLACTAVCAVIFGTKTEGGFTPLTMGRSARRATPAQWTALVARDRGCVRCGRGPRFCEAHHVVHWSDGGGTDLSNLALLCSRCHHDLHRGRYAITMSDGLPYVSGIRPPPIRAG